MPKPERHTGMIDYNSREALKAKALKHRESGADSGATRQGDP